MKSLEGFHDDLAEEVMSDLASHFFGKRVAVDEYVHLVHQYADILRKKAARLEDAVRLLNYLLITEADVACFWRKINVRDSLFRVPGALRHHLLPEYLPTALTTKGRYTKLVVGAYQQVYDFWKQYMLGNGSPFESDGDDAVTYGLLKEVCTLVNQKMNPGKYSLEWNPGNLDDEIPEGFYILRLRSGKHQCMKKIMYRK